ncbi:MAG TPA: DUF3375 family protein, partial [Geoalkalibacter subterraneus]|nr:DUF3375 family protein [Geoalkalibacter subterraneus]
PVIADVELESGEADVDTAALYAQIVVDRAELLRNLRQALQARSQVTLAEVVASHPLRHGLAELLTYLQLAAEWDETVVDEQQPDLIEWRTEEGTVRRARLPRIVFLRTNG